MLKLNRVLQGETKLVGPKNANRQYFSGEPIEQLDKIIRETIQNPLDHPLDHSKPVKVILKHRIVNVDEIPEKEELIRTLDSLVNELKKHKKSSDGLINEFINSFTRGKNLLSKKNIPILQISDYNTIGLTGSIKDTTSILGRFLGSTGYFDDDGGGGGSGGLGKFAPFLASMINFCFYSSFNIDEEYIYYGWGDYFTHELSGKKYRPEINIGAKNSDVLKSKVKPKSNGFLFERNEKGTDVFAIGFDKPVFEKKWEEEIAKAVIRNYFGAIIDKKLVVEIVDNNEKPLTINNINIGDYLRLFNKDQKSNRNIGFMPDGLVVEAIEAFQSGQMFEEVLPVIGKCKLKLISDREKEYSRTISYMRKPRMLIFYDKKNIGDIPFSAVFYTDNDSGNEILRITEDSHHKKWNFENHPKGKDVKKEIKKFIEECIRKVCTNEVDDEFEISGTSLLSFGSKRLGGGAASAEITKEATATLYPVNPINFNNQAVKAGESWIISDGGRKKKINPKKPKYKKREEEGSKSKKADKKREYYVKDFKPSFFKNDDVKNEYHFFIKSDIETNIRRIDFAINKAEDVQFISEIIDSNGSLLSKDTAKDAGSNTFENFPLIVGLNKFIIKTIFNKKLEIIIS
jgi:hypothetical protein